MECGAENTRGCSSGAGHVSDSSRVSSDPQYITPLLISSIQPYLSLLNGRVRGSREPLNRPLCNGRMPFHY
ncbi:hypothetical protein J6590_030888, partial [Homalodisca vitripennis]